MIRNWFYKCRPEEFPMASISFINRRIWSSLGYYLPNQLAMKILQTIQKHNKNRFVSLSIMRRRICCEQTFRHNCCFVLPKNKSHSFMNKYEGFCDAPRTKEIGNSSPTSQLYQRYYLAIKRTFICCLLQHLDG